MSEAQVEGQGQGQELSGEPSYDRQNAVDAMVKAMDAAAGEDAPNESESELGSSPDNDEPKPEEPKAEEPKAEEKPAEFSADAARAELEKVLEKLTPEQRDEVLGATNEAFAALTAKTRRLRERESNFVAEKSAFDALKREHDEVKGEWDEALIRGRENPLEALQLFGWSLEDAHAFAVSDNQIPHEKRMKMLEESVEKKIAERLASIEEKEQALESERETMYRDQWHGRVENAIRSATAETHPNLAWYLERNGGYRGAGVQRARDRAIALQTQVFDHFKGEKILADEQALAMIENEIAAERAKWRDSDPAREGAVQSAKPEAGREPVRPPPTSEVRSERASPPVEDDDEELTPDERVRRMVAAWS